MSSQVGAERSVLRLERDSSLPLEQALRREWLETDGLGGYASSTMVLCHTRRYHGLLVTPPEGSGLRHSFLSRYDDSLHRMGASVPLSIARYRGLFAPHGHINLEALELHPFPAFLYRVGRTAITREVQLVRGSPTCLCRYRLDAQREDLVLRLKPLLPFRRADSLTFENLDLQPRARRVRNGFACRPYAALPEIHITVGGADWSFEADPVWYRGLEYPLDLERGYDGHEDNFSPGFLDLPIRPGQELVVAATLADPVDDPIALWRAEAAAREAEAGPALGPAASPEPVLRLTSRAFLHTTPPARGQAGGVTRTRLTVTAGFPWFSEWGRDTFIALPGLTLDRGVPGGLERCREVLDGALPFLREGLMPNVFGTDAADSQYGSVDAALWFARAVRLYQRAGAPEEDDIHQRFLPALVDIAENYREGRKPLLRKLGIRCDEAGLITAGGDELNPTWMDAVTAGGPVTPRHGCAVEINALWYSLLAHIELLFFSSGDRSRAARWRKLRRTARRGFLERFWLPGHGHLADLWRDGEADVTVRPNMVIAAALEWSPLTRGKRTDVVRCAQAELLTPRGLRTLDPRDPRYRGHYRGKVAELDAAYHQGTVWPWLLGFYCEAYLRAFGPGQKHVAALRKLLDGFRGHLSEHGLLHVSEVFDGDPPHDPGGAIAQAWSTAELLRAYAMLARGKP